MNQQGYLLIADITGYTEVLSETELEHAEDILRNLFNALTNQVKSPWTLHELEGDAIFAHVLDGGILQAQTLLELVDNFYRVFAKTLENRHRNITCQCKVYCGCSIYVKRFGPSLCINIGKNSVDSKNT